MRGLTCTLAIASCSLARDASGATRPIVAVFDIENRGSPLQPAALERLSDLLATELVATEAFQVVPRDDVRQRIQQEQLESYRSCYHESCQIELGRELAAEAVLGSQLVRVGQKCHVNLRLYDLRLATNAKAASVAGGCAEEDVLASLKIAIDRMMGIPLRKPEIAFDPPRTPARPKAPESVTTKGLDFGDVDVEALELYDAAVRIDRDDNVPAVKKMQLWEAVALRFPQYKRAAKERMAAWSDYAREEAAFEKVRLRPNQDFEKLKRLLKLDIVSESDKEQWALAFVEAYGADPEKNPHLGDPDLQKYLGRAEWPQYLAQVERAKTETVKGWIIDQFLKKHPGFEPAVEAKRRHHRTPFKPDRRGDWP
jgi:hypothetical protein